MDDGATPLFVAAHQGDEGVVRGLVKAGAEVNKAKSNGTTPLFIAAQSGHVSVVRGLVEAGAEVNKARDDGATPLSIARGDDIRCLLIDANAE